MLSVIVSGGKIGPQRSRHILHRRFRPKASGFSTADIHKYQFRIVIYTDGNHASSHSPADDHDGILLRINTGIILRKKALIRTKESSDARQTYLTAMDVSSERKIHPSLHIDRKQFRSMGKQNRIAILRILKICNSPGGHSGFIPLYGICREAGIMDPCNVDMMSTIYACEALTMRDRSGRKYNRAYRQGKVGVKK